MSSPGVDVAAAPASAEDQSVSPAQAIGIIDTPLVKYITDSHKTAPPTSSSHATNREAPPAPVVLDLTRGERWGTLLFLISTSKTVPLPTAAKGIIGAAGRPQINVVLQLKGDRTDSNLLVAGVRAWKRCAQDEQDVETDHFYFSWKAGVPAVMAYGTADGIRTVGNFRGDRVSGRFDDPEFWRGNEGSPRTS
jgi:hypothetical protein